MVVHAVIWHWFTLVAVEKVVSDDFRWSIQWLAEFLYVNDNLLASPRPSQLQAALVVLARIFGGVGLQTSVEKTVGIVCQP